ncbi:unnamed protein product [Mytilus coruscus]|uniref:G-protein coupled receptors family 1 profile domain-containing protein n=1 Tax=Mytilus coruscus TaxID=42192 RepID=A0A6J8AVC2_MYTCO|nr:unnamed protein product [Mytilus coruscus]
MEKVTCEIPLTDPANMTSTVANVTSIVANMTSNVAIVTSTVANVTSIVANMTSNVANVTSTVANVTSIVANMTEMFTDIEDIYPPYVVAFLYFFFTVIIVMNVPSAFIVVVSFFRNIDLKNSQVLLSLSITDMLFGVCCAVIIHSNLTSGKISYKECLLRYILTSVSYSVSNTHVFSISLERVFKICLKMNIFTKNRKMCSLLSVILSWAFSCTFIALVVILMSTDNGEEECSLSRIVPNEFPFVPLMVISIQVGTLINISILVIFLFRHHRQMQKLKMLIVGRDDVRLCITVTIVSAVCTILHMPWNIIMIYGTLGEPQPQFVRNAAFLFAALTSLSIQ